MSGANLMDPFWFPKPIQLVQKAGTELNVGASIAATFGATPTENNLLIAVVDHDDNLVTISTPAGWTQVHNITGDKSVIAYFYKVAGGGESATVTVTFSGSATGNLQILEYEGIVATSPLDVSASNDGGSSKDLTCPSGTTAATAQANSLAVSGHNFEKQVSGTAGYSNGFTEQATLGDNNVDIFLGVGDKILTATGTQDTTLTVTGTASTHIGVIAVFKGLL